MQEHNQGYGGQSQVDPQQVAAIAAEVERARLTGIGGWLIVFLVLVGLSTVAALLNLVNTLSVSGAGLFTFRFLVSTVLGAGVIILMMTKKRSFPSLARVYLIIEMVLSLVYTFLVYDMIAYAMGSQGTTILLLTLLVTIGLSIAWVVYFGKSKRVQYTFVN